MTSSGRHGSASEPEDDPLAFDMRRTRSLERIAQVHQIVLAIGLGVALLWLFSDVLLLLFAATLIACQLSGVSKFVSHRTKLPYGVALALIVVVLASVAGTAAYFLGPRLAQELRIVWDQVNGQVAALWHRFGDADWLKQMVEHVQAYLRKTTGSLAGVAAGLVTSTLGNLGTFLLIVVAAIYLAASPEIYSQGLVNLMPHRVRKRGREVMAQEARTLRRWFLGQLVDMTAIGVLTGTGLWMLGVPLAPTLGLVAAMFNFVPYIGALAGSVPAIVVALGQGPQTAVYVAILFVVVQTFEGNVLAPLISRRTVDLPPVLTLISQTVLGALFGPFGLILATPITAGMLVLVEMLYVESCLGDQPR